MIINLCGVPCGGKSTFAAKFIMEHPSFRYCPIDEYRIEYEDERRAWSELTKDVLSRRHCLIESCGMGWRLGELLNLPTIRKRPLLTIAFTGDKVTLLKRLRERQHKRPLPEPYDPQDEYLALDFALEHFSREVMSEVDAIVDTTERAEDEIYHEVNLIIQRELLFRSRERKLRGNIFPSTPPRGGSEYIQRAKER